MHKGSYFPSTTDKDIFLTYYMVFIDCLATGVKFREMYVRGSKTLANGGDIAFWPNRQKLRKLNSASTENLEISSRSYCLPSFPRISEAIWGF